MTHKIDVVMVGATSLVAEALIAKLEDSELELGEVEFLDSDDNAGEHLRYNGKDYLVKEARQYDFSSVGLVILLGERALASDIYPLISTCDCEVIDATGLLADQKDIPLVIPEGEWQNMIRQQSQVALPDSTTLQLYLVLRPLNEQGEIDSLQCTAMLCVARAGKPALEELGRQTAELLNFREVNKQVFDKQVAFNLIPQVGEIADNGQTATEVLIRNQIARLLNIPPARMDLTICWSPVFYGDSQSVHIRSTCVLNEDQLKKTWRTSAWLNTDCEVPTPVTDASGNSQVFVGRIRQHPEEPTTMSYWSVTEPAQLMAETCLQTLKIKMS